MEINGIELTKEEEQWIKHIIDTGLTMLEYDENFPRYEALLKKLGVF